MVLLLLLQPMLPVVLLVLMLLVPTLVVQSLVNVRPPTACSSPHRSCMCSSTAAARPVQDGQGRRTGGAGHQRQWREA